MSLRKHGPGLYGWGRYQARWSFDFNGSVLVGDGQDTGTVLVVDPVAPTASELEEIRLLGSRFHVILLNADHERDSAAVAAALGADVYVPRSDRELLRQEGAISYDSEHVFPGGWRAIALGDLKTPGETVLHHPERRVLVVGDAVVGDPVHGMRLVPPQKIPDLPAAMRSIARLLSLDFETLLLSDGYCLSQGGHAVLEGFVRRYEASL